jgi:hypothetical protein
MQRRLDFAAGRRVVITLELESKHAEVIVADNVIRDGAVMEQAPADEKRARRARLQRDGRGPSSSRINHPADLQTQDRWDGDFDRHVAGTDR